MVDLMEHVLSAQTRSDERMIELEKRMKMDERQIEREAQQCREESFKCK